MRKRNWKFLTVELITLTLCLFGSACTSSSSKHPYVVKLNEDITVIDSERRVSVSVLNEADSVHIKVATEDSNAARYALVLKESSLSSVVYLNEVND